MRKEFVSLAAIVALCPTAVAATSEQRASTLVGTYAGVEAGAHEHHFFIEETDLRSGQTNGRYYRAWGLGGGAFVGHDLAVADGVRVGVEAGISIGGNNPVARFSDGTTYTQHPRYGYRATSKVGYLFTDRLLAYGTFGYGGHRYRLDGTAVVAGAEGWRSSFTIGAGFEYQLSPKAGLRLDFRHLDNSMSHILVGVPVRL